METSPFDLDPPDDGTREPDPSKPDTTEPDPFTNPSVLARARVWGRRLEAQGISDLSAEDLLQEAWRSTHKHLGGVPAEKRPAYLRRTIENCAKMRVRRRLEPADDPMTGRLSTLAADERPYDESETRVLLDDIRRFMHHNRERIQRDVTGIFGPHRRCSALWAASVQAVEHLVAQDLGMAIDELLSMCLRNAHEFWRADRRPDETLQTAMERRRKRAARDTPRISYIALYVVMRWAYGHNPGVCRALARLHLRHIAIAIRECKNHARKAALRVHLAEVRRAVRRSPGRDALA